VVLEVYVRTDRLADRQTDRHAHRNNVVRMSYVTCSNSSKLLKVD